MNYDGDEATISMSNVSLKLAEIQRRCSKLINSPEEFGGLALEEPVNGSDGGFNPYDRG